MACGKKCNHSMDDVEIHEIYNDCCLEDDPKPHLPFTTSEILDCTSMVRTIEDSQRIVQHFMTCHQIISVDIKGRDLGKRNGKVSLLAVGTCNGNCLLFDIHCNNQLIIKGQLKDLLQCKELIKVIHECRLICSALDHCYGIKIQSIFDTQCAHAVIEGHRCRKNPRCISQETLLFISSTYGRGVLTPAAHALERLYLENCNFWDTRPLPCKLKDFAARCVLALLPEVYNNLNRQLRGPLRHTYRAVCQRQCFELADHNALHHSHSTSCSCKDLSKKPKKTRSLNMDYQCRSCSPVSSHSSSHSGHSSLSCFKCNSSDSNCGWSRPFKKACKTPKFRLSPKKSSSVFKCAPKKKFVSSCKSVSAKSCNCIKCTSHSATCSSKRKLCTSQTEICNCVKCTESVSNRNCLPKKKIKCKRYSRTESAVSVCPKGSSKTRKKGSVCASSASPVKQKPRFVAQCRPAKVLSRRKSQIKILKRKKLCLKPILKHTRKCSSKPKSCKPKKQTSTCLCKILKKNRSNVGITDIVRNGWEAVMDVEMDSDHDDDSMDTDESESDFENEMPPPAKRKR